MTIFNEIFQKHIIPYAQEHVKYYESIVRSQKKGLGNFFKGVFKKSERNEGDGLKASFRMNENECSLINLVDTSFIF